MAIDTRLRPAVTDYVHPVGTCRMGRPGDPAPVVDTHRRVGVPDLPKANTHLITVAIAERLVTILRS